MKPVNLEAVKAEYNEAVLHVSRRVIVCAGTGCVANGALKVHQAFAKALEAKGLNVKLQLDYHTHEYDNLLVSKSGCQGFCQIGPLVRIEPDGLLYTHVRPIDVEDIVEKTLLGNTVIEKLLYKEPKTNKICRGFSDNPFYATQKRNVMKDVGYIDPEDAREYIGNGGYAAAEKAFTRLQPQEICDEVLLAGLRGRGGGGFPTGKKWYMARVQPSEKKYIICNGDEGDPGAFMDQGLMEGNPHAVLEGMMIAARAIGADEAYVYVRTEYPRAVARMRKAVQDATELGLLGENVFGSGLNMTINVMEGAGAFVCGEETALMASIEGKRGMPSPKPPFPSQSGLWGKPTVINNVETFATVPLIIKYGAAVYKQLGTEDSPGTKTFALAGHVANTGLIEVPFGSTLREIIYQIGGGVTSDDGSLDENGFKAVQIGGPSGGCLTKDHLDVPLDYGTVTRLGAMIGSGGLVVMNEQTCIVQIAKFFMQFTQHESCGKCVLCREGTKQMLSLLEDITEGKADDSTIRTLEQLASAVQKGSLCGLGKSAPNPVLSTLEHFRAEYEQHVVEGKCSCGKCEALAPPMIHEDLCKGCMICARKCPTGAITGEKKEVHHIDPEKCIKCGVCAAHCKFNAITGVAA
ncbi:MAG: NADH-quinone oxidoreductase subunit F [Ectothiorhodospiraceae bacterium]|nr:NADH-quinone oxidoreductase subunit F [Ectothiorhodospiraceae bacterium]